MGAVAGKWTFRGRIQEPQVYPAELRLRAKGALQLIPEICRRIALYKNIARAAISLLQHSSQLSLPGRNKPRSSCLALVGRISAWKRKKKPLELIGMGSFRTRRRTSLFIGSERYMRVEGSAPPRPSTASSVSPRTGTPKRRVPAGEPLPPPLHRSVSSAVVTSQGVSCKAPTPWRAAWIINNPITANLTPW